MTTQAQRDAEKEQERDADKAAKRTEERTKSQHQGELTTLQARVKDNVKALEDQIAVLKGRNDSSLQPIIDSLISIRGHLAEGQT